MPDTILLVDVANIYSKSKFKLGHLKHDGRSTGGMYGFMRTVRSQARQLKADQIILAFEGRGGSSSKRKLLFEYKADREGKVFLDGDAEDLKQWGMLYGVGVIEVDGLEADDCIGCLAEEFAEEGHQVYILSDDHDFFRALRPGVIVLRASGKEPYDMSRFIHEHKYHPEIYRAIGAIAGDTSDNYSGVVGLGEWGAYKLLEMHDFDLEKALTHQRLAPHADMIRTAYEVFGFKRAGDVPMSKLVMYSHRHPDPLGAFYMRLGMASMAREFNDKYGSDPWP